MIQLNQHNNAILWCFDKVRDSIYYEKSRKIKDNPVGVVIENNRYGYVR